MAHSLLDLSPLTKKFVKPDVVESHEDTSVMNGFGKAGLVNESLKTAF